MAWLVKAFRDGNLQGDVLAYESVSLAVLAGNAALRNAVSDDVTIVNRDHDGIYYQFSTIRTLSEEQRIARLLEDELAKVELGDG